VEEREAVAKCGLRAAGHLTEYLEKYFHTSYMVQIERTIMRDPLVIRVLSLGI